jgi:hypothetical protein
MMSINEQTRRFIREHIEDDVNALLLKGFSAADVDIKTAAVQIAVRQRIKSKLPSWYADDLLLMPSELAAEQCSSEITARYKGRFGVGVICDLTGGMGVDSWGFSTGSATVIYVEKNAEYCHAAKHNFKVLGAEIEVVCGEALELLQADDERLKNVTLFYIDPSRRGANGKRVFALHDCEPDLTALWKEFDRRHCRAVAKLSPMLDISAVLNALPDIIAVHVVAVRNECKELLIEAERGNPCSGFKTLQAVLNPCSGFKTLQAVLNPCSGFKTLQAVGQEPVIRCVNIGSDGSESAFEFRLSEERDAVAPFADRVGRYICEPNAAVLKAGAFKTVAMRYGVTKIARDSHLYTADNIPASFPGNIYEVIDILPFDKQTVRRLSERIPQAEISVRNFPLSVEALRRRLGIADGCNCRIFATTLNDGRKVLIITLSSVLAVQCR